MRCPSCTNDHKRKDGMICGSCQYTFVFDPKVDKLNRSSSKLTDNKMISLLNFVSANETFYFTFNQLASRAEQYLYREKRRNQMLLGFLSAFFLILLILFFSTSRAPNPTAAFFLGTPFLLLTMGLIVSLSSGRPQIDQEHLEGLIERWEQGGNSIPLLLRKPRLQKPPKDPEFQDIYDYGVERILLVQRDLLVDLFVLNQWHTQNKALVLSETGYPSYLLPQAQTLLDQHPELPVFLLHDATRVGMLMSKRIKNSTLLHLGQHKIVDIGLFHKDVQQIKRLHRKNNALDTPIDALPYVMLSSGLGAALAGGLAFADLLKRPEDFGPMDFG